jgi:hypothetical protein
MTSSPPWHLHGSSQTALLIKRDLTRAVYIAVLEKRKCDLSQEHQDMVQALFSRMEEDILQEAEK